MIDPVTMNARRPEETEHGTAMLERMNQHHGRLYAWGLAHTAVQAAGRILDIGCGGGQNLRNLSEMLPEARLWGMDYSQASIKKTAQVNREAVACGRLQLQQGSAESLPYPPESFDLVTAFETTYYWPEIGACFSGVYRCLAAGGEFLVCNEDSSRAGSEEVADALAMQFYTCEELEALLRAAGFAAVRTERHENGRWVCAVGIK